MCAAVCRGDWSAPQFGADATASDASSGGDYINVGLNRCVRRLLKILYETRSEPIPASGRNVSAPDWRTSNPRSGPGTDSLSSSEVSAHRCGELLCSCFALSPAPLPQSPGNVEALPEWNTRRSFL